MILKPNIINNIFLQNNSNNPISEDKNFKDYVMYADTMYGIVKKGMSPSDIWFLKSKDKELVLKISLNKNTIPTNFYKFRKVLRYGVDEDAIQYEINIYKYIVNKLVDYKINPFFVKTEGVFEGISFDEIVNSTLSEKLKLSLPEFKWRFFRNTIFMSLKEYNGSRSNKLTPSISSNIGIYKKWMYNIIERYKKNTNNLYYNVSIFEKYTETLHDYHKNGKLIDRGYLNKTGWNIIIQVLTALSTLEILKVAHNDLHTHNLFIKPLEKDSYKYFKYNDIEFVLKSDIECKIFDWDGSYTSMLGNNPGLNDNICNYSLCNEYLGQREVFKFMIYFILQITPNNSDQLLEFLIPDRSNRERFKDNCDITRHLQCKTTDLNNKNKLTALSKSDYNSYGFRTPTQVLTDVVKYVSKEKELDIVYPVEDDIDRECIDTDPHVEKYDFTSARVRNIFHQEK